VKNFRAYWNEDEAERPNGAGSHLRVVSGAVPPRPRWGRLYAALAIIGGLGTVTHFLVAEAAAIEVVDAVFALALFMALATWVRLNRVAIARSDEPDAGAGRPRMRVVRSRRRAVHEAHADERVVRLDPDERVVLPYDFR
jgi:hypothetical protein